MLHLSLHLPFEEPVNIITLFLVILLIDQVFFELVRIPSIPGLFNKLSNYWPACLQPVGLAE